MQKKCLSIFSVSYNWDRKGFLTPPSHTTSACGSAPGGYQGCWTVVEQATKRELFWLTLKISRPPTRLWTLTWTGRLKLKIEHDGKSSPLASGLRFINQESTTMPSADFCPITSCITTWRATTRSGRKVGQISPGKNMILPCTTAAFTISRGSDAANHAAPLAQAVMLPINTCNP